MQEIPLTEPYTSLEGVATRFVKMRPKVLVGDWRYVNKISSTAEERTFQMVCRLCGLDAKEVESMCMADFTMLAEKVDMGDNPKAQ